MKERVYSHTSLNVFHRIWELHCLSVSHYSVAKVVAGKYQKLHICWGPEWRLLLRSWPTDSILLRNVLLINVRDRLADRSSPEITVDCRLTSRGHRGAEIKMNSQLSYSTKGYNTCSKSSVIEAFFKKTIHAFILISVSSVQSNLSPWCLVKAWWCKLVEMRK